MLVWSLLYFSPSHSVQTETLGYAINAIPSTRRSSDMDFHSRTVKSVTLAMILAQCRLPNLTHKTGVLK